jgi:hypothetical protein
MEYAGRAGLGDEKMGSVGGLGRMRSRSGRDLGEDRMGLGRT